ncbi:DUF2167 domain-containing protein [Chitinophaga arvensicola]|uniref:Uncharacterized membrane-anchored protein n=1 Tax=Chitinophaga arvensicola TaxID=29529 RepID=A0A1I0S870_9BACT|nr:DUF2167 domain-containing protein [Chitinophaga arvensicola]SEW52144.1 Uncharacterized membrane-anchored protein [Chitinophaga arvensicola]
MKYLFLAACLFVTSHLSAAPITTTEDSTEIFQREMNNFVDSVKKAQHYETGSIKLEGGKAEIKVPAGFKFLNKKQSQYVLTTLWGNPPESSSNTLGMIFPENSDPFADSSYAFVVEYEDIGYVKDDDAEKIDYKEMMKNLQEGEQASNEERAKQGYSGIHLIGWAQQPFYDKQNKVLHWAKEIRFDDQEGAHTLNYEIRILGRHGVLSLNAVCKMSELPMVKADISKVLHMATFTDGNTYFDFDPKVDNVAAWSIGGLVAGKVLAKVGFFAIILKYLAAGWKFIALGFMALIGFFKRMFSRKKEQKYVETFNTTSEEGHAEEEVAAGTVNEQTDLPASPEGGQHPEDKAV